MLNINVTLLYAFIPNLKSFFTTQFPWLLQQYLNRILFIYYFYYIIYNDYINNMVDTVLKYLSKYIYIKQNENEIKLAI